MSFIKKIFGGDDSAKAATQAAQISANADREALEYLKQQEKLPTELRDEALKGLAGYYQVPGEQLTQDELVQQGLQSPLYDALTPPSQQELLTGIWRDPLYRQIMGTKREGEEAILRNASATGGLRSGNANEALYAFNSDLKNKALLTAYQDRQARGDQDAQALLQSIDRIQARDDYNRSVNLTGLSGLAQLQGNEDAIANLYSSIGSKTAQGVTGAAQAKQDANNNMINTALAVAGLFFSDIRMKKNIRYAGRRYGHNWYTWEWNDRAAALGLSGSSEGVLAHEVYEKKPEAVKEIAGFIAVDYGQLRKAA